MDFLVFLLSVLIMLLLLKTNIENALFPAMPNVPLIPQSLSRPIVLSTLPRDQALDKLFALCPEGEAQGIFQTHLFFNHYVWITDYTLFKEVTNNSDSFQKKTSLKIMELFFGRGLFFSNGEVWQHHRRVLQSSFAQTKFTGVISDSFIVLAEKIDSILGHEESSVIPIHDLLGRTVFQTMGKFAYNFDYKALEDKPSPYFVTYSNFFAIFIARVKFFVLMGMLKIPLGIAKWFPYVKEVFDIKDELDGHYAQVVDDRRKALDEMSPEEQKNQTDVLAKILLTPERDFEYTKEDIVDDMKSLFFAGHETTAASITFCLYFLAKHPEWQIKARIEARRFMDVFDPSHDYTRKELEKSLPCLHLIILESWRLYPPASDTLLRYCAKEDAVIGGHPIPKDSKIIGNIYAIHHSKTTWGEDAAEFRPERFCVNRDEELGVDPALVRQLMTFSHGGHSCLGNVFATIQINLGLAHLMSRYKFGIPEGSPHAERIIIRPVTSVLAPVDFELTISRV